MEQLLGGKDASAKFCASIVRQVLQLAVDKGSDDPRHESHWWPWENWPIDGRQWEYDGSLQKHKLDKKAVAEHDCRTQQQGFRNSNLKIERLLEGAIWGDKKYPNGRTALRSSASFPRKLWSRLDENDDDSEVEQSDEEDDASWWLHLFLTTSMLKHRYSFDASICCPEKICSQTVADDDDLRFSLEEPFSEVMESTIYEDDDSCHADVASSVLHTLTFYICTDDFAVNAEQEQQSKDGAGTPSISVSAMATGIDNITGKETMYAVIAEAPLPLENLADNLQHRIAGFVFSGDVGDQDNNTDVRITYVESSLNDLQTLTDDEKDAYLEDRALIIHRVLANSRGWDPRNTNKYIQTVPTMRTGRPSALCGLPPIRTLKTMHTVHRADPRYPLTKPNTSCLECGRKPRSIDPTSSIDVLLTCSKCHVRKFCSRECVAKSWVSDTFCHKIECKRARQQEHYEIGTSVREKFKEVRAQNDIGWPHKFSEETSMSILEKCMGLVDLDEKIDTVEELRARRHEHAKEERKARKAAKKKRKGKKKT